MSYLNVYLDVFECTGSLVLPLRQMYSKVSSNGCVKSKKAEPSLPCNSPWWKTLKLAAASFKWGSTCRELDQMEADDVGRSEVLGMNCIGQPRLASVLKAKQNHLSYLNLLCRARPDTFPFSTYSTVLRWLKFWARSKIFWFKEL